MVKDAAGLPVQSSTAAAKRWLQHFTKVHDGTEAPLLGLFAAQRPELLRPRLEVVQEAPDFLPSQAEVLRAIRRIAPYKAF
eukprot:4052004-Alexandrium_andersonii.AAC.1